MTKVIFLLETCPDTNATGEVFAYFPDNLSHSGKDHKGNLMMFYYSYSHTGQHSPCQLEYAKECKKATPEQYADLLRELKGQGYNDLEILNKQLPLNNIDLNKVNLLNLIK